MNILNIKSAPGQETQSQAAAKDPVQLSRCLQQAMLQLKADHMSPDGRGVDYAGIASGKAFADYLSLAEELIECDPTSLSEEERMAFFISILLQSCHSILTSCHSILTHGILPEPCSLVQYNYVCPLRARGGSPLRARLPPM